MATSFDLPENRMLNKISDRDLLGIDETSLEGFLDDLLISSFSHFRKSRSDLSYDANTRELTEDLLDDEIEILALIMVREWARPILWDSELLKQRLSPSDYQMYSQANHIGALSDAFKYSELEYKQFIQEYVKNTIPSVSLYN